MSSTNTALKRLQEAKHKLELARTSREVAYGAVPYLISAELLLANAITEQEKHV